MPAAEGKAQRVLATELAKQRRFGDAMKRERDRYLTLLEEAEFRHEQMQDVLRAKYEALRRQLTAIKTPKEGGVPAVVRELMRFRTLRDRLE